MSTQSITGLASGLDTTSIIEALMSIERKSYDRTSEKVEAEKLKLQAYQSVNSMLSSLKTAVNTLSSSSLWNAKTTASSNESSLKATANQYAVEGSYSMRVAQLATSAQYMSKGYSSATSTVLSSSNSASTETSYITLESSQARVDNSAKLEELNGGNGIYRGSVRITDASGASTVVDLSACETIDQVVTAINNAAGIQVQASIRSSDDGEGSGDRLEILDMSGGAGSMKIQNVGQGTTATDLGIAQTSTLVDGVATITGTDLHYLSANTSVSALRDGLGIEDGMMCITIKGESGEVDVYVDLNNMQSVGDILNATNTALQNAASGDEAVANLIGNLKLSISDDGNALSFTGAQAGNIYTVANLYSMNESGQASMSQPQTVNQLGLLGTFTVENDGDSIDGKRILGDLSSPMLTNLSGANQTGIGSEDSQPKVSSGVLDENTKLSSLNGGEGVTASSGFTIRLYEGGGMDFRTLTDIVDSDALRVLTTDPNATLGDLVNLVNESFANCGVAALEGVTLNIDSTGMGVYLDGFSSTNDYEIEGDLAVSLGLVHVDGGNSASGYGNLLAGVNADAVADLYSYTTLGADEYSMIFENTTLGSLYVEGEQLDQEALDDMLQNGMSITIGEGDDAIVVDIDLSHLTADSNVQDLMDAVNYALEDAVGADAPYLYISFDSMGLNWRNVDVGSDFVVSGDVADAFGFSKDYEGQDLAALSTTVQKNLNPVTTGTATNVPLTGDQTLASLNDGKGLDLNGKELTLTLGEGDDAVTLTVGRDEIISALGGNYGAATVDEYLSALNSLFAEKIAEHADLDENTVSVNFGINAAGTGLTITSVEGLDDGTQVALGGALTQTNSGFSAATGVTGDDFAMSSVDDIRGVEIEEADIAGLGYIRMEIDGQEIVLTTDNLTQYSTLNDLIATLNSQLKDLGLDMSFTTSDSGSGLAFTNDSNSTVTFKYDEASTLASDLGLVGTVASGGADQTVAAKSHLNGTTLNRNYIDRSTSLASLNNGQGADTGSITITDAQGASATIDLSEALTVGDVIDAINGTFYNIKARINDAGDGILIYQTNDATSSGEECTGNITVKSADGTSTAEHLGIAGTGTGGKEGMSQLNGSMKTTIEVGANDTLTDIMNRISDAGYKTSIINDGTGANSYRLSITSAYTGAGYDFIIDTNIDALNMQQVSKGQDSMVLYGEADSGMSPVVLKSSTNSNSQAILGMTLELNSVSDSYTTITVTTDTSQVVDAISELVQAYNDLSDLITYLDSYDTSTETKGILFGDSTIRTLMDTIDEMFYQVYNPNSLTYADLVASGTKSTWSWMDLGISFSSNNSNSDGESGYWYSRMELDLDTLNDMVANNWDALKEMLSSQRNVSDSTLAGNVAASSSFNFQYDRDENGNVIYPDDLSNPNNAINGNKSSSGFGVSNGFVANKTIAEGENQYTVYFQTATTIDRVSIYHPDSADYPASEYALSDFVVEYLDANTGKWEVLREVSGNASSSTILGTATPLTVSAIRITASDTNAEDGKFRLVDVQCLESNGLAGQLKQTVNSLTDVVDGFFTQANSDVEAKIADLQEQMTKQEERLTLKETALWRKFNNLESVLSQLNSQSSYLTTMFSSLSAS